MAKRAAGLLRVAVAVALLWLLWRLDLVSFVSLLRLMQRPWLLLAALALTWGTIPLAALRWQSLLACQGVRLPFGRALWYTWLGTFANNFVPASLGGDVSRAVCLFREAPEAKAKCVASLVGDRVATLFGVLLTAWPFGLALAARMPATGILAQTMHWMLGALVCCVLAAAYALLRPDSRSVSAWLERRFGHTVIVSRLAPALPLLRSFRASPGLVLLALLLAVANQFCMILALFIFARILDFPMLSFGVLGLSTPLSLIMNMLPFSPGGIGIGEAAFANINAWLAPGDNVLGCATVFLAYRLAVLLVSVPGVWQIVRSRPAVGRGGAGGREPCGY